jgi:hypothetical protein
VIAPGLALPAVECSFGVKPIQATKCRPERKSLGAGAILGRPPEGGFIFSEVESLDDRAAIAD